MESFPNIFGLIFVVWFSSSGPQRENIGNGLIHPEMQRKKFHFFGRGHLVVYLAFMYTFWNGKTLFTGLLWVNFLENLSFNLDKKVTTPSIAGVNIFL